MSVKSPPASARASLQAVLTARRLACEPCSSRHGCRAPPRRAPIASPLQTPGGPCSYAELLAGASAAAAALAARGVSAGERVAIALEPGLEFAHALHACMLLGAVAVPVDLRLSASERAAIADGCALASSEPLSGGAGEGRATRRVASPRARRAGRRDPHIRHELGAEADRADLRQPAVERARLGRRARPRRRRALAVRAAAVARRRPLDPGALGDLRDDGRRARALRDRARPACAVRAAR